MEEVPNNKWSTSIFLQIVEHPDGSISRPSVPNSPPAADQDSAPSVLSKDVVLNPANDTTLRIYLPNPVPGTQKKLPIIIYFHGGGFVLFSPGFIPYHQFCERLALAASSIVVSLDYRLAPENRLPAAYDDAVEALQWVSQSTDPWINEYGDFHKCFISGSSSGGNMAYFAGLHSAKFNNLGRVKVHGIVLIQPYFGGEERTKSEVESEEDDILPLRANEMMWRMALPLGSNRDHQYCNPLAKTLTTTEIELINKLPKTILFGCKGDPLFDRHEMFVEAMMNKTGMNLSAKMDETGYHAIELFDPVRREAMCDEIKGFIYAA